MNEPCYYRISVKGIVVDENGRFLLTREEDGRWEMLGGGLDHNENPIVGLQREIYEETGLEVTHVSSSPKYFVTSKRLHKDSFIANVVYEIKLKNLDFTPSDECQELRFFTVGEARREALFPNVVQFLEVYDPTFHRPKDQDLSTFGIVKL